MEGAGFLSFFRLHEEGRANGILEWTGLGGDARE